MCADCVDRYAAFRPRCATCGLGLGLATPRCGECLRDPPPFARTVCVADYGFPWDGLIAAFKFQGRAELAGLLAERLCAAIEAGAATPAPELVLPVPLSPQRLAERGYDQAWELARRVARRLRLPAQARLLQRPIHTLQQSGLHRSERQRNLRTAFMADPRQRAQLQGRRVALVDDVMTTGATLREASAVLLRAGAASVDLWVLARTPDSAPAG
jgi:ComF family protein